MSQKILGIDVGGTKIQAVLYEAETWKVLREKRVETAAEDFHKVLGQVIELVDEVGGLEARKCGIGWPGYVAPARGIIYKTPNINLPAPFDLNKFFTEKKPDIKFSFDNDANAFILAEYQINWRGTVNNLLGLTLGTGFGGGLILNGELYRGRDGFASEFGHTRLNGEEFEDHLSGRADRREVGHFLGLALANLINIFNPEAIVLGGSVTNQFDEYEKEMWREIEKDCVPQAIENLPIKVSELENAGALGAAILCL